MIKHLILFFLIINFYVFPSCSTLLDDVEVQDFVREHRALINSEMEKESLHMAYATVTVASTLLTRAESDDDKLFFSRLIESVMCGKGFGGINTAVLASEAERSVATSVFVVIGAIKKSADPSVFQEFADMEDLDPLVRAHYAKCQSLLKIGIDIEQEKRRRKDDEVREKMMRDIASGRMDGWFVTAPMAGAGSAEGMDEDAHKNHLYTSPEERQFKEGVIQKLKEKQSSSARGLSMQEKLDIEKIIQESSYTVRPYGMTNKGWAGVVDRLLDAFDPTVEEGRTLYSLIELMKPNSRFPTLPDDGLLLELLSEYRKYKFSLYKLIAKALRKSKEYRSDPYAGWEHYFSRQRGDLENIYVNSYKSVMKPYAPEAPITMEDFYRELILIPVAAMYQAKVIPTSSWGKTDADAMLEYKRGNPDFVRRESICGD